MLEEEEKRIKALELEHQEMMTSIHTFSWIVFTIFISFFIFSLSIIIRISEKCPLMGVALSLFILILSVIVFYAWYKKIREISHHAKEIRNQIFKLEEKEMGEE